MHLRDFAALPSIQGGLRLLRLVGSQRGFEMSTVNPWAVTRIQIILNHLSELKPIVLNIV